jgi:hypothetical protein
VQLWDSGKEDVAVRDDKYHWFWMQQGPSRKGPFISHHWRSPSLLYIEYEVYVMSMRSSSILVVVARSSIVLRHCATNQKVVGSSPDEVNFFNWPNPSSRTMALGSTQPLTEMSTRNLPGGVKGGWHVGLTTLLPSVSRLSRQNVGASTSCNPMGLHGLLQG